MTPEEKQDAFIERMKRESPYFCAMYRQLIAHEKFSKDQLQELTFRRRANLLRFAYERTAFYRKLYDDNGIHPNDIKSEEDWKRLPLVTKQMLRDNLEAMCIDGMQSREFKKYAVKSTSGGSTGNPAQFFIDRRENGSSLNFNELRAIGWWLGREKGELLARNQVLFGQNEVWLDRIHLMYKPLRSKVVRDMIAQQIYPQKRFYLDIMKTTLDQVNSLTQELNREGAFYVMGTAGGEEDIAKYYVSGEIERRFQPAVVASKATPLTPAGRRLIEQGFGCPVRDIYATNEVSYAAFECPHAQNHALHVTSDLRYVDIVDENGINVEDGQEGTVVVTDFMNHVMPLIRYSLGDRTSFVKGQCSCGLPFPLINPVKGRETDYVVASDGSHVNGCSCAFDTYPNAANRFQLVQRTPGKVIVRVVPNKANAHYDEECHLAMADLNRDGAGRVEYVLEYVEDIPLEKGKIRFVVYE